MAWADRRLLETGKAGPRSKIYMEMTGLVADAPAAPSAEGFSRQRKPA